MDRVVAQRKGWRVADRVEAHQAKGYTDGGGHGDDGRHDDRGDGGLKRMTGDVHPSCGRMMMIKFLLLYTACAASPRPFPSWTHPASDPAMMTTSPSLVVAYA